MVLSRPQGRFVLGAAFLLFAVGIYVLLLPALITAGPAAPKELDTLSSPQGQSTLGDYVWHDTNLNGLPDIGEQGIDNVLVKLYLDDGDAIFEPGTGDTFQGQMVTGDDPNTSGTQHGWYDFNVTGLKGYWVVIDTSNFGPGQPLEGYVLTSETTRGPNPMYVYLTQVIEDYNDADFGYARAAINLVKVAGSAPDGGIWTIVGPGTVTYTYTVTNPGETPLANVALTDNK